MLQRLGDRTTTAQVHPRKLTEAFMARAEAVAGSQFRRGAIDGVITAPTSAADGSAAAPGRVVTGVSHAPLTRHRASPSVRTAPALRSPAATQCCRWQ